MAESQLVDSVSKIVVFLLVFFSFFLLTVKRDEKISNQLFSVFLLLAAFDMSGIFLSNWFGQFRFIENLRISSVLLQMPVFYLYVLSVCYAGFSIQFKHTVHGLLFIIFLLFFSVFPYVSEIFPAFQIVAEIQYAFYIILSLVTLKRYKRIFKENYSNAENLNYKWLVQMLAVLLAAHFFVLSKLIIKLTDNEHLLLLANIIVMVSALSVTSFFVLKALYQPQIFRGIDPDTQPISAYLKNEIQNEPEPKKETPQEAPEMSPEILSKIILLENFITENEPYTDADLTIQKLADQLQFSTKELSFLINHHIGKHFFDFINEYRIQKAMEILKNPAEKHLTVLEILYKVGFNSKSSFNTAFKKHSQFTPTEFRKHSLSENYQK